MTSNSPEASQPEAGSFFKALFDMSFTDLITMRFLKVIYMVVVVFSGIGAFFWIVSGFTQAASDGLLTLITGTLGWILYVVLVRVALEVIAVLFQIRDNTKRMADGGNRPV